jgi:hypothetical protein
MARRSGVSPGRTSGRFRFQKHAQVGAPAAEDDAHFLKTCFIDTGDLKVLRNIEDHKALVVGRVGTGKSALLEKLKHFENHVIEISLFNVSLEHISNSEILKFFLEAGVHLDLFYKALWRHVFTVELIKERHGIHTEADQQSVFKKIWNLLPAGSRKKHQIEYLKQHAGTFWKNTDERVKEVKDKTEKELKASVSGLIKGITLTAGGTRRLTQEQLLEVRTRGQEVINQVKIRDLNEMFDLLKTEVFSQAEDYFIVIDKLDEHWADEPLRLQLIKAIIETIRDFRSVPHVKIIVCIRSDLFERVYRRQMGVPQQQEKIRGLYLDLKWTRHQLIELLDARINQLAVDCYTTVKLSHADLLPESKKRGQAAIDYLLDRTFYRPRDVISYFNFCISHSIGSPRISRESFTRAEEDYSKDRLQSLSDEWGVDYPYLYEFASLFKKRRHQFRLGDIAAGEIDLFCLDFLTKNQDAGGTLAALAKQYMADQIDDSTFRQLIAGVFYHVGLLGIKLEAYTTVQWSLGQERQIMSSEIDDDCSCAVHKMFWFTLGIVHK